LDVERQKAVWVNAQSFYARWRLEGRAAIGLREDNERPAERLLQLVWYHQRLLRDRLKTLEG